LREIPSPVARVAPVYTIGKKYIKTSEDRQRAEDREKPDDSPVTSGARRDQ
jgi:hypothetical protein